MIRLNCTFYHLTIMISQILSPKFYFCAFYHDDNLVVKYTIKPNDSKRGGGVVCAQQDDLDTHCLVFLSESVAWTHLGYFPTNGTTLHLSVKVRRMHHIEYD